MSVVYMLEKTLVYFEMSTCCKLVESCGAGIIVEFFESKNKWTFWSFEKPMTNIFIVSILMQCKRVYNDLPQVGFPPMHVMP